MLKVLKKFLTVAETVTDTMTEKVTEALTDAAEAITESVTEAAAGGFHPGAFVENLKYMAAGMIGIFLVIGVIVLTIVLLGKLTAPKKNNDDE